MNKLLCQHKERERIPLEDARGDARLVMDGTGFEHISLRRSQRIINFKTRLTWFP